MLSETGVASLFSPAGRRSTLDAFFRGCVTRQKRRWQSSGRRVGFHCKKFFDEFCVGLVSPLALGCFLSLIMRGVREAKLRSSDCFIFRKLPGSKEWPAEPGPSTKDVPSPLRRAFAAQLAASTLDERGTWSKEAATNLRSASASSRRALAGPSTDARFPSWENPKFALQPFIGKLRRTRPTVQTSDLARGPGAARDWPFEVRLGAGIERARGIPDQSSQKQIG